MYGAAPMNTYSYSYHEVKRKLMSQMRRCRDKDIRIKVDLILYALKYRDIQFACKKMGFGRSFFYKWWGRLVEKKFNIKSLEEKSRRPKHSPRKISPFIEQRIKHYRKKGFGALMIREFLRRESLEPCAVSTIQHVINKRKPPVVKRKFKLKKHRKRYELDIPGERLQIDVKYSPMQVGGKTVYIYVAIDECTRWRYAYAYDELNQHWTYDFLERMYKNMPFPIKCIQSDNGQEFTFRLLAPTAKGHLMDVWCKEKNIEHQMIPPGVKELNGKVERSHRIDADYFYGRARTSNIKDFNKQLENWIKNYNLFRPHGGISFLTPVEKLKERITSLGKCSFEGKKETWRQKFVKSTKLVASAEEKYEVAA